MKQAVFFSFLMVVTLTGFEALTKDKWTMTTVLQEFSHEPSVRDVQIAAIRYYQVHPERIKSLMSGASLKGLVPSVSVGFSSTRNDTSREMLDYIYYKDHWKEYEDTGANAYGFNVNVGWDLKPLVFNAEVLDVASLIGILDGVVREVTTTYYIRRRLQISMLLNPSATLADQISDTIRIDELTGLLDALTGGFMSSKIKETLEKKKKEAKSGKKDSDK